MENCKLYQRIWNKDWLNYKVISALVVLFTINVMLKEYKLFEIILLFHRVAN